MATRSVSVAQQRQAAPRPTHACGEGPHRAAMAAAATDTARTLGAPRITRTDSPANSARAQAAQS